MLFQFSFVELVEQSEGARDVILLPFLLLFILRVVFAEFDLGGLSIGLFLLDFSGWKNVNAIGI